MKKTNLTVLILFLSNLCFGAADDHLAAHWTMDDNSPNLVVLDSSGQGNNGTYNHAALSYDVSGDLSLKTALGRYSLAGVFLGKPYYQLPDNNNGGFWTIFWNGDTNWLIGCDFPNLSPGWISQNSNIANDYSPISGPTGTATVAVTPDTNFSTALAHVEGIIGGALRFNKGCTSLEGIGYVDTGKTFKEVWSKSWTANWWCKTDAFAGTIIGALNHTAKSSINISTLFCAMGYFEGKTPHSFNVRMDVPDEFKNKWCMFTNSVEQAGSKVVVKLYLNGVLYKKAVVEDFDLSAWSDKDPSLYGNVFLAAAHTYAVTPSVTRASGYFNCELDDVMIFNKALSKSEISALYRKAAPPADEKKRP